MNVTKTDEDYTIRGNRVHLEYNKKRHTLLISSPSLDATANDMEEELRSLGIYTRVGKVEDREFGEVEQVIVPLKPAASVELRDGSGSLVKRPVSNQFSGSTITKRRGSHRYTSTVNIEYLREIGVEHKDKVSLYAGVKEGHLSFEVVPDSTRPHSMVARMDSTGTIRIPSSIGAIADLDGHGVQWKTENGSLIGITTVPLLEVPISEADALIGGNFVTTISKVSQDGVEHDGKKWSQERHQIYFHKEYVEDLGWKPEQMVDIRFGRMQGELVLLIDGEVRDMYTDGSPSVKRLYQFKNGQYNMYLPNALAYSMGLSESKVEWSAYKKNGGYLVGVPL